MEVPPPSSSQAMESNEGCRGGEGGEISSIESITDPFDPVVEVPCLNGQAEPVSPNPKQSLKSNTSCERIIKKSRKVSKSVSSSSGSCHCSTSQHRGFPLTCKRRNPRVLVGGTGRRRSGNDFDALGLPLGMSIAAVVAQVLERKNAADESIPVDHLSSVCSSAVKESLANVFGNQFDCFIKNFEKSFSSTLKTLRLINETSLNKGEDPLNYSSAESYTSEVALSASLSGRGRPSGSSIMRSHTEVAPDTSVAHEPFSSFEEIQEIVRSNFAQSASLNGLECPSGTSIVKSHAEVGPDTSVAHEPFSAFEEIQENTRSDFVNRGLILHGQTNQQLTSLSSSTWNPGINNSILKTYEKSVMEQARSNNLKTISLGLKMEELQLKKSQLALKSDLNYLERFKLSIGISKASFKVEKFKTQLEDTRHAELLKKCIDCFVAGLLIMSASLLYGAYVYSYERLTEITTSCNASPKESKSWWLPKQVTTFNSVFQMVRCQVQVASRMLFSVFIIFAVAYLLFQRPSTSQQNIPVTFLLLGVVCGFAGKLCVDTLGGDGYSWLLFWEALCLLHLFSYLCTSILFSILHGPISVSQVVEAKTTRLPFWIRRLMFYSATLFFLPLLCGLLPFAGLSDWTSHFFLLSRDSLLGQEAIG